MAMLRGSKSIIFGLACATAISGAANAGGFNRGTADTDILFEEGGFNMRAGAAIVMPQRGYETITSPLFGGTVAGTDGKYSDAYAVPTGAFKIKLAEKLSCAGTYTQSFGAGASYGPQAIVAGYADGTGVISEGFTTDEFGLTCGANFAAGPGRFWLIGGVYAQDFNYSQTVRFAPTTPVVGGTDATLSFDDQYRLGYRVGAAFEVPEIAARAQILYRSAVSHTPNATQGSFSTAIGAFPTFGSGTLPQSVEFKVQSGIAAGTLAFASVKWTDWSVLQTLNYTITTGPFAGPRTLEYFWRDGWTVNAGVGRQFNDVVAGSLSLTWDQGVSTTEDAFTDTWTLAGGISLKDEMRGELRLGGGISYLTSGAVALGTGCPGPTCGIGPGNSFGYTVDGDWSYAVAASYKVNW
jgi:long-chain fatty acid transport protein